MQTVIEMKTGSKSAHRRRGLVQRLLVAAALTTVLALAACTPGGQHALLLDSVPADAVLLGSVQPQRALGDSNVRQGLDQVLGLFGDKTLEDVLTQVQDASGIDPAAVEQVLVFQTAQQEGAALVAAPYSEAKIKEAAEEEAGSLEVTVHRGHDLYTAGEDKAFAFLADDLLLVGSLESAKAVVDVRAGEAAALDGELRDAFVALGDPPAKLFLLTSDGLFGEAKEERDGSPALDDLPIDISFLTDIRSVGATVDAVEEDFALTLTVTYPDADQAAAAQRAIETLLGLVTLFDAAPELSDLLDGLDVSAESNVLTVTGRFSPDDLEGLADALSGLDIVE